MINRRNKCALVRIQDWYASQCNGDWEHTYGVAIGNIDNPGWRLDVELRDTELEYKPFEAIYLQREDEHDWVHCRVRDLKFSGNCGPFNLEEMLLAFLEWAE